MKLSDYNVSEGGNETPKIDPETKMAAMPPDKASILTKYHSLGRGPKSADRGH
jgi:hypothetical protein